MYGVRLHNNKFILIGKSFERELSQEQLEHLADDGATVLIDLDADGLMFIFEYFLEKLDSLKIVSYGLTIKKIHYKRLQVKNSALFGVGGDNIT